jgi:hypothetical protein
MTPPAGEGKLGAPAGDGIGVRKGPQMELILAIVVAGPTGYLIKTRRLALGVYLALWAIVFPIQSVIVGFDDDFDPFYLVVNAVILCVGIGLNRAGSALGERRRAGAGAGRREVLR